MAPSSSQPLLFSSREPRVTEACQIFHRRLLRLSPKVEEILALETEFPDDPTLRLSCAFLWLFAQTPQGQAEAGRHLAAVDTSRLNSRERAWKEALTLWHQRAFESAAQSFEILTETWPEDLPAIKAVEFVYYILGQQNSGPRFRALMERLAPYHPDDPDFLGVKAFAHELCGDLAQARENAERAIDLVPLNPWAHHALEHLLLWEGSSDEAISRLEKWLPMWDEAGRVIHCHNAWHVALMHLDRLEPQRAFTVFDEHVWNKTPDLVVEQLDAIAFLWRAEMAGVEVDPQRYRAITPHLLPLAETLFMPFVSAHYAYAFAKAGEHDALRSLLRAVELRAEERDEEAIRVWAPVGRSIIEGVAQLGLGNPQKAAEWLTPVMGQMMKIGGSDAQDDLFRFAHLESLRASGDRTAAKALLERRMGMKRPSPLEEKLLAEI